MDFNFANLPNPPKINSQSKFLEMNVQYTNSVLKFRVESMPCLLQMSITGGAGTGKSHVVSVIKEHLEHVNIVSECLHSNGTYWCSLFQYGWTHPS